MLLRQTIKNIQFWKTIYTNVRNSKDIDYAEFNHEDPIHQGMMKKSFTAGLTTFGIQKQRTKRNIDVAMFDALARKVKYKRHNSHGLEWHVPLFIETDLISNLVGELCLLTNWTTAITDIPESFRLEAYDQAGAPTVRYAFHPQIANAIQTWGLDFHTAYTGNFLLTYSPRPYPRIVRYKRDIGHTTDIRNVNPDMYYAIKAKLFPNSLL